MSNDKDSAEVIKFVGLFNELKKSCNDDPKKLIDLFETDQSFKESCLELENMALVIREKQYNRPALFAVSGQDFIAVWRDYRDKYEDVLSDVALNSILGLLNGKTYSPASSSEKWEHRWWIADRAAEELADGIRGALDFAEDQATQEWRDFPEGFRDRIEEGVSAWNRLRKQTDFDLRRISRRRRLIPFTLIPEHVAKQHKIEDKFSLYNHLRQAHDAFIFGAPFAALALMRSIMEIALREHYRAKGEGIDELINYADNQDSLPQGAEEKSLNRLRQRANAVLHWDKEKFAKTMTRSKKGSMDSPEYFESKAFEREMVMHFLVLKDLIELAPY